LPVTPPTNLDVRRTLLVLVPTAALALCLYAVPLPLFVEGPGPARDVLPLIDIDGTATYQPDGRLLFTTVNVGRVNVYDAVAAAFDEEYHVVPEDLVIPEGLTDEEYDRISLSQMGASKIAAISSALVRLTDYPREHGPGALIYATSPGAPAAGRLFPGELITAVDGEPVSDVEELGSLIEDAGTGATLEVTVEAMDGSGDPRTVELRTVRHEDGRPVIGIVPVPNFPFEVSIQSGRVGGPSAGLMWSIGVTDLLTPGDLAGGRTLAGTGGIDLRGRVRPIGGVSLKVLAAERAGADVFVLPRSNLREAREVAEDIEVVPVANLDQALEYIHSG
jgi:PDZ domain-containing protein